MKRTGPWTADSALPEPMTMMDLRLEVEHQRLNSPDLSLVADDIVKVMNDLVDRWGAEEGVTKQELHGIEMRLAALMIRLMEET